MPGPAVQPHGLNEQEGKKTTYQRETKRKVCISFHNKSVILIINALVDKRGKMNQFIGFPDRRFLDNLGSCRAKLDKGVEGPAWGCLP